MDSSQQPVETTVEDSIPDTSASAQGKDSQHQPSASITTITRAGKEDSDDPSAAPQAHETLVDPQATCDHATSKRPPSPPPPPPPIKDSHPDVEAGPAVAGSSSGSGSGGDDLLVGPPPPPPPRGSDSASLNASSFSVDLSIDTDSSDADSALGSLRGASSSMSATSSIFDFVEEHGRTWHRYKEGKYFMPNDLSEQERLELQHAISLRLLGALYLAPVAQPHRVLDLGTGTGIWAIDFAHAHPAADVLGTDLSPIQPEYVPPNCRFEVDDAEDEWVFSYPFDFIHSRYMSGSFGDFPALFATCYQHLTPGGWIEFQDYVVKLRAVDDSLRGTALERWNDLVIEGVRRMGKNANACLQYKAQMRAAGFVDVREERMALPGNPWAKGEEQKMLGTMQMENILDGLHGFSIGLFTKMMGMSTHEVEVLLVDVRKDLRNTKIHFYYLVYVLLTLSHTTHAPSSDDHLQFMINHPGTDHLDQILRIWPQTSMKFHQWLEDTTAGWRQTIVFVLIFFF